MCRALATLQLLSGYRLSLVDAQDVQRADFTLSALSRPSHSFNDDRDPSSSDGVAEGPVLPQYRQSFEDLLAPGAAAYRDTVSFGLTGALVIMRSMQLHLQ